VRDENGYVGLHAEWCYIDAVELESGIPPYEAFTCADSLSEIEEEMSWYFLDASIPAPGIYAVVLAYSGDGEEPSGWCGIDGLGTGPRPVTVTEPDEGDPEELGEIPGALTDADF